MLRVTKTALFYHWSVVDPADILRRGSTLIQWRGSGFAYVINDYWYDAKHTVKSE